MATQALKIERLSKNFGGVQVLSDLSFYVELGERVAIIGPNGAGKTTLFNLISGELPASGGRIYVLGQEVTGTATYLRARMGLSRSFQLMRLPRHLTVLHNMLLALHGVKPSRRQMFRPSTAYAEILAEARRRLESVDLWEKRDDLVQTLCYGEQKKLGIAVSLALEPRLLLMDEPTAGLDIAEVPAFVDTVKTLTRDTTTVFACHDMNVVFDLADRVLVLYYGRIVAEGSPAQIETNPAVKQIYLGIDEDAAVA